jgi:iron complex transport system substrate-binding protein
MRKGIEIVESMNNKIKGGDKKKMKKAISLGIIGIIVSAMLLTSMVSPALANESSACTPRAFVYGDANEDATVDMRDVTYIKLVLFKKKPETKLADANYDGKISMLDVGQTKLIVLGKEKELTLLDMADRTVTIPQPPERVVALSRGLVDSTMVVFGVDDKLVGYGECDRHVEAHNVNYIFRGKEYKCFSARPEVNVNPRILELPYVGDSKAGINFETVANLNPDIVIMRTTAWTGNEYEQKTMKMIEGLGIPLVVLCEPDEVENPSEKIIYEEIGILGEVFDKQEKAQELANFLEEKVSFITARTEDIPEEEKPTVLYFCLSRTYREKGAVGGVHGVDMIESIFLESIVNAKNAFRGTGRQIMSSEQVLDLDPDLLLLPTCWGFHPASELSVHEDFKNLQDLRAIKEKRVYSLPYTSCRTERLEFPIPLMIEAKAAYPDRFADVNVFQWVLDYYKDMYDIDDETAIQIMVSQRLYWMDEEGF